MPSIATTNSRERGRHSPTRTSGPTPFWLEQVGDLVGPVVELSVGEGVLLEDEGGVVGMCLSAGLEEVVDSVDGSELCSGLVPVAQDHLSLCV